MKKWLCLLLSVITTLLVPSFAFANEVTSFQSWEKALAEGTYPVSVEDAEWKSFETHQEMLDACQIPDKLLSQLDTGELLELVLEYPLLIDFYAFDNLEEGLNKMTSCYNGLIELVDRDDCAKIIADRYIAVEEKIINSDKRIDMALGDDPKQLDQFEDKLKGDFLATLLQTASVRRNLSVDEIDKINQVAEAIAPIGKNDTTTTVSTPNGSKVTVIIRSTELTAAEKAAKNNFFQTAYPNAIYLSTSTNKYNCHSYAWYSQSTSNKYWMNDPSKYITDGSYKSLTWPTANGQKVVYGFYEHSAVVVSYGSSIVTVKSKWGAGPLMQHNINYSPYNGLPKYYKRSR